MTREADVSQVEPWDEMEEDEKKAIGAANSGRTEKPSSPTKSPPARKDDEKRPNKVSANVDKIVALTQKQMDLDKYLNERADELWKIASEHLKHNSSKDKYLSRLALAIANDEKLNPCFQSPAGKLSIVDVMRECIEIGVMPGRDCYIVPYTDRKGDQEVVTASLQPKYEAYIKICRAAPHPLFSQVLYNLVYETDDIEIDEGEGTVRQKVKPGAKSRGEITGVWVKMIPVDPGQVSIVRYWGLDRILKTRDQKSKTWRSYLEKLAIWKDCENGVVKCREGRNCYIIDNYYGKKSRYVYEPSSPAWLTDPEKMYLKTVIKSELKPYALIKPGLENLYELDERETPGTADNVMDRFEGVMDKSLRGLRSSMKNPPERPPVVTDAHANGDMF